MSKKDITPEDTRYVPLTQQKSCCVPTCIQMVMLKNNIPLIPAEKLGYYMGLTVHPNFGHLFYNARVSKIRPPSGYGTQTYNPKYAPNVVFKKLKIPLKMSWSLINKFENTKSFKEYLSKAENKDILVCYDWPTLFDPKEKDHWGHVCVLDKVYLKEDKVRIIDPEYNVPKWQLVDIDKLYDAMKFHGKDKSGGFWELNITS